MRTFKWGFYGNFECTSLIQGLLQPSPRHRCSQSRCSSGRLTHSEAGNPECDHLPSPGVMLPQPPSISFVPGREANMLNKFGFLKTTPVVWLFKWLLLLLKGASHKRASSVPAPTKIKRQNWTPNLINAQVQVWKYLLSRQEYSLLTQSTVSINGALRV